MTKEEALRLESFDVPCTCGILVPIPLFHHSDGCEQKQQYLEWLEAIGDPSEWVDPIHR